MIYVAISVPNDFLTMRFGGKARPDVPPPASISKIDWRLSVVGESFYSQFSGADDEEILPSKDYLGFDSHRQQGASISQRQARERHAGPCLISSNRDEAGLVRKRQNRADELDTLTRGNERGARRGERNTGRNRGHSSPTANYLPAFCLLDKKHKPRDLLFM